MATKTPVVDVHTHMYPPEYIQILEARDDIPIVRSFPGVAPDPRIVLLSTEMAPLKAAEAKAASGEQPTLESLPGRPLTTHYASVAQKIHFMDTHGIDVSVLSLANPWLDFVASDEAGKIAASVNSGFSAMCAANPGRLFFFATLPVTAPADVLLQTIKDVRKLPFCRGVILGTGGLGKGLDDPEMEPVLEALGEAGLIIFLHPHYGLPGEVWGPRGGTTGEYGHVLPLALGFPMETTIAVTRLFLAGVFDRLPKLRMLLAHSGGTLPFLAGRIDSCVRHDGHLWKEAQKRRSIWDVLHEQVYLDAVVYSDVGLQAAVAASGAKGLDRLMFGTDHPFFPPLGTDEQGEWESVSMNADAVAKALGDGTDAAKNVMGGNAARILDLVAGEQEKA
ncbi:uracil-5-carboxylate decarboxylase [Ophiostoma piceae UAMH 11346]|uniref:Uracil-5-carboxylate decarboxylase n=1 Tax=Ophiostoma piceae (strain UAMH 11346) TaxID=1262450 RepID=S3C9T2_OPHP1|nr:uracil-5-carboxylate decarboxylase [Ophiostoma piceae UAMH 11346]